MEVSFKRSIYSSSTDSGSFFGGIIAIVILILIVIAVLLIIFPFIQLGHVQWYIKDITFNLKKYSYDYSNKTLTFYLTQPLSGWYFYPENMMIEVQTTNEFFGSSSNTWSTIPSSYIDVTTTKTGLLELNLTHIFNNINWTNGFAKYTYDINNSINLRLEIVETNGYNFYSSMVLNENLKITIK